MFRVVEFQRFLPELGREKNLTFMEGLKVFEMIKANDLREGIMNLPSFALGTGLL